MTPAQLTKLARKAIADCEAALPALDEGDELAPLVALVNELIEENRALASDREAAFGYIREKINQLLVIIGTIPLKAEELDNKSLISLDPIGVVAQSFSQILTHVRQTNDKLGLAMEEIKAIFEAVGGGIVVLDRGMHIVSYNRGFMKMFSDPGNEINGRSCLEVVGAESDTCPAFAEMMRTATTAVVPDLPLRGHHYSVVASPVRDHDGNIVRAVLLYLDITDLIRARAALAEEKERLLITLESIAEGVIATGTDGCVTLMNRVAERLTGWEMKQAIGKPICEVLSLLGDKELNSCTDLLRDALRGDGGAERFHKTMILTQNGEERLVSLSAAPIVGQEEDVAGAILVFRDITNEKKLEEEMFKSARIDSLGLLAGGIAHDFNNLLTTILGNIGLTTLSLKEKPDLQQQLAQAEKACLKARDITQQLMTFAKGGAPIKKIVSIADLVREDVEFALRGSNITSEIRIDDGLWLAEVDRSQISQVLNNLIINAKQAMPQGGKITVRARNFHLPERNPVPLEPGDYIQISVIDEGMGIPPAHLNRIFDPYFTTKQTGSGLGLASSYAITKKHGGHLGVYSKLGEGSTFTLYLPAVIEAKPADTDEGALQEGSLKAKVLVMDDDESIRKLVAQLLARLNLPFETASDGEEALALYKAAKKNGTPFDVVIMDLTVPGGMGGAEAMSALLEFDPEVKAIVSSGYSIDSAMAEHQKHGFKAVMPKPFELRTLVNTIKEVLAA